jgi:hypothetical protein
MQTDLKTAPDLPAGAGLMQKAAIPVRVRISCFRSIILLCFA